MTSFGTYFLISTGYGLGFYFINVYISCVFMHDLFVWLICIIKYFLRQFGLFVFIIHACDFRNDSYTLYRVMNQISNRFNFTLLWSERFLEKTISRACSRNHSEPHCDCEKLRRQMQWKQLERPWTQWPRNSGKKNNIFASHYELWIIKPINTIKSENFLIHYV